MKEKERIFFPKSLTYGVGVTGIVESVRRLLRELNTKPHAQKWINTIAFAEYSEKQIGICVRTRFRGCLVETGVASGC
jgi:hypothetical protein